MCDTSENSRGSKVIVLSETGVCKFNKLLDQSTASDVVTRNDETRGSPCAKVGFVIQSVEHGRQQMCGFVGRNRSDCRSFATKIQKISRADEVDKTTRPRSSVSGDGV